MKRRRELVKELVREAYEFGYFIGYRGHSEWADWVRKTRDRLYSEAERLGAYELVRNAYRSGKEEGAKKREEDINLSLLEKGKVGEETTRRPNLEVPAHLEELPAEERREFLNFLETTKILMPPELLDSLKHLGPPKMLRLGD